MQSTSVTIDFPTIRKKVQQRLEPKLRSIAEAVGFSIQAEMNRTVEENLTREVDAGDTNNMARALFSTMKDYSGPKIMGKFGSVKWHETKFTNPAWKRGYEDKRHTFGFFSLDRFKEVIGVQKLSSGGFSVTWFANRLAQAVKNATKVIANKAYNYSTSQLNENNIERVFNHVKDNVNDIAIRVKEYLSRRLGY